MKKLFIVANWKSNKNIMETEQWLHDFNEPFKKGNLMLENKEIIVSPSFTLLEHARYCLGNLKLSIKLAAQNISPFDEGQYTGEVNARQIKEVAELVIIGHSERRKCFYEDDVLLAKKIDQAKKYDIKPIFCVQGKETKVPEGIEIVAYEPVFAIGSGNSDTPQNADSVSKFIKKSNKAKAVLYGGSVTSRNVKSFTKMPNIDGVLVGGASLNPLEFLEIVKNA